MANYSYVDTTGNMQSVDAADDATALKSAPNIDPHSGVSLNTSAPSSSAGGTEPTVGQAYQSYVAPTADTAYNSAVDTGLDYYGGVAKTPVDEQGIRSTVLQQFQKEIDASNQVYAEKLAEAKQAGLGRLGNARAIQARSGNLGSDFASAQNDKVDSNNRAIEGGILDEQNAKVQSILADADKTANDQITQKRQAQQQGLTAYLDFLGKRSDMRTKNLATLGDSFVNQGITPDQVDPTIIKNLATSYGVSTGDIINAFKESQKKQASAGFTLNAGQAKYAPDGTLIASQEQKDPTSVLEYNTAVSDGGFSGTYQDWLAEKANLKVSQTMKFDPLTGEPITYQTSGPGVAGGESVGLPKVGGGNANLPTSGGSSGTVKPFNPSDTTDNLALAYIQTGTISGKAKSYPGIQAQVIARANELMGGTFNPTIAKANAGAIAEQTKIMSNVAASINTADQNFKLLLDTATKAHINDQNSPIVNQLKNAVTNKYIGNGELNQFNTGIATLRTEYAQVLARGGAVTDSVRSEANQLIPDDISLTNLNKVYAYIKQEGQNVINERQAQIKSLSGVGSTGFNSGKNGQDDTTFVEKALSSQGIKYNDVISKTPSGQIPVIDNDSGQVGYISPEEFNSGSYTRL